MENLRFGSVCSGIEAASVAWEPLGWKAAWFAEIEPFPCAVLAHHYPEVPNLGDMSKLPERVLSGEIEAPDVFCGGTPCQAFSVAGLRRSLDDARGNLSLVFCEIADAIDSVRHARGEQPAIIFWENVPGVLSTKDNAFGCFLAGLAGEDQPLEPPGGKWTNAGVVLGPQRALAWAVTDAQYFGVAQRRRRVFVVASAREGFDPVAVLFEPESVRRDTPPSREAGEGTAAGAANGAGVGGVQQDGMGGGSGACGTLRGTDGGIDLDHARAGHVITMAHGQGGAEIGFDRGPTLTCNHEAPIAAYSTSGAGYWREGVGALRGRPQDSHENVCCVTGHVTHTLNKAEGFDASEDGTGRGQPIVCFSAGDSGNDAAIDICPTIRKGGDGGGNQPAIAFSCKDHGGDAGPVSPTLRSMGHDGSHANAGGQVAVAFAQNSRDEVRLMGGDGQIVGALAAEPGMKQTCYVAQPAMTFQERGREGGRSLEVGGDVAYALTAPNGGGRAQERNVVTPAMQVRRLTPRECERLQGFPDDYTLIPHGRRVKKEKLDQDFIKYQMRGNPKHLTRDDIDRLAADGPRYKALGNSWAVPNVRWIGRRIQAQLTRVQIDATFAAQQPSEEVAKVSREYTVEEARAKMMQHVLAMVKYWASLPDMSAEDRCDGVAFSIMTMLDGAANFPRCTVAVECPPDDQKFYMDQGENWFADGMVLNADCDLHDVYSEQVREAKGAN